MVNRQPLVSIKHLEPYDYEVVTGGRIRGRVLGEVIPVDANGTVDEPPVSPPPADPDPAPAADPQPPVPDRVHAEETFEDADVLTRTIQTLDEELGALDPEFTDAQARVVALGRRISRLRERREELEAVLLRQVAAKIADTE